jgi:uncharacterized membrane protein YdjX (TVP38/TMEM64 family)
MEQQPRGLVPFLLRRRGDRRWDAVLWGTGVVGLLGIPIVLYVEPGIPLVWFSLLSIVANSPLSPIFPASFEPLIMEASKYSPAIAVTLVGLAVYMYTEYFNWYIYAWVLGRKRLEKFRTHRQVKRFVEYFSRRPVATVIIFAFTPLPFWVARILAILHGMPVRRFMVATAIGRFPRIFFYAWIGDRLQLSGILLLGIAIGAGVVVILIKLAQRRPVLEDTVIDSADEDDEQQPGAEPEAAPSRD